MTAPAPRPILLALLPLFPLASVAVMPHPPDSTTSRPHVLSDEIDAIFRDMDRDDVPGCAVGVIQDGQLVYGRGYGMANLEHGIPLDTRSVFRMGSVGKQFTAGVVAHLALEGRIDLDAPIRRYLPELPDFADGPVTLRHLVHHTSGYRDYLTLMALAGRRDEDYYDDAELYRLLTRQEELNFPAGSDRLYSNSGYFLLAQLVHRVTGRSLAEEARVRIFEPLGMAATHYHDHWQRLVPRRATGYAPAEWYRPGADAPVADEVWPGYRPGPWDGGRDAFAGAEWVVSTTTLPMIGDGGVYSSVEEMARWAAHLLAPREEAGGARWRELVGTRGRMNDGEEIDYAFGLYYGEQRGLQTFGHGGAFVGYRADVTTWPEAGTAVVTLCNRADVDPATLGLRVGEVILADRMEPAQTPAADRAAGSGEGAPSGEAAGGTAPPEVSATERDALAGRYESAEVGAVWEIESIGDEVRMRVGPAGSVPVVPVERDVWNANGILLRVQRAADGGIEGLRADAGRVRNLRFIRR